MLFCIFCELLNLYIFDILYVVYCMTILIYRQYTILMNMASL